MRGIEKMEAGARKKISCFNDEQQRAYDGLTQQQRAYVDYRSMGYGKTEAYKMAGYTSSRPSQASNMIENTTAFLKELIEVRTTARLACGLTEKGAEITPEIIQKAKENNALSAQKNADMLTIALENADAETKERIKFYRKIISGEIKSTKTTTYLDKNGESTGGRIEEIDDVKARMDARKELDRIIGVFQLPQVGEIKTPSVTIRIVDAGLTDEMNDSRNTPENAMDLTEESEQLEKEREEQENGGNEN